MTAILKVFEGLVVLFNSGTQASETDRLRLYYTAKACPGWFESGFTKLDFAVSFRNLVVSSVPMYYTGTRYYPDV